MEEDNRKTVSNSRFFNYWYRIPIVIRAIVIGFIVFAIAGSVAWTAVLVLIPAPWSLFIMVALLILYLEYFGGRGWPKSTSDARKRNFRKKKMSGKIWMWSLVAALLAVVVFESGVVITFRLVEFPADAWTLGIDFSEFPLWQVWLFVLLAAIVAGVTEEVGFRGYMQVPLEKRYGPAIGIIIVSITFMLFHLNQAWAIPVLVLLLIISIMWGVLAYTSGSLIPGIISHTVTDIFNFSYWWTDIAGTFDKQPIKETGIDTHFFVWVTVFIVSVGLFVLVSRKTLSAQ